MFLCELSVLSFQVGRAVRSHRARGRWFRSVFEFGAMATTTRSYSSIFLPKYIEASVSACGEPPVWSKLLPQSKHPIDSLLSLLSLPALPFPSLIVPCLFVL